jgi:DNA damage-binding protein 1
VLGKGSYLSVLEAFKNIAPIVDAALVDTDGSDQVSTFFPSEFNCECLCYRVKHQIITCSGGKNTGSLNVVRNGADFQALAVAEGLRDIVSIWPIRALFEDT